MTSVVHLCQYLAHPAANKVNSRIKIDVFISMNLQRTLIPHFTRQLNPMKYISLQKKSMRTLMNKPGLRNCMAHIFIVVKIFGDGFLWMVTYHSPNDIISRPDPPPKRKEIVESL